MVTAEGRDVRVVCNCVCVADCGLWTWYVLEYAVLGCTGLCRAGLVLCYAISLPFSTKTGWAGLGEVGRRITDTTTSTTTRGYNDSLARNNLFSSPLLSSLSGPFSLFVFFSTTIPRWVVAGEGVGMGGWVYRCMDVRTGLRGARVWAGKKGKRGRSDVEIHSNVLSVREDRASAWLSLI